MTGASFRFKKSRKKKESETIRVAIEGSNYCQNYDSNNITCINCYANNEGLYRAGCYKKG